MSSALASAIRCRPSRSGHGSRTRLIRCTHERTPASSRALRASATVERAQSGGLGDPLIAREAETALGVVEGPQERLEHRQRLGRDDPYALPFSVLRAQAARPVHDPDLGVAIEGAGSAEAEHLLASLRPPGGL